MRRLHHLLLLAALPIPSLLGAQQRGVEIGLDSRALYDLDSRLLLISIPVGRARAAFPAGDRLAFEPAFSFARVSADGGSVTAMVFEVGAVYDFTSAHSTYTRPFVAYEYADATSFLGESVVDLGIGFGTRAPVADRLAFRIEGIITGRFGVDGGADGLFGVMAGLSFFTK
jgi:hypothetical protein